MASPQYTPNTMTVPETFISQSVSNISQIAIETLNEGEGKLLGIFDKSLKQKTEQAIATASAIYAKQYLQQYGRANIFGMSLSVPLDTIYIEGFFWLSPEAELLESLQNPRNKNSLTLQQAGNISQPSIGNKMGAQITHRTALGVDAVNENRYLLVFGETGAGKSTFLRKTGLDILQGKKLGKFVPRTYLPMLIECKSISNSAVALEKCLVDLFRDSNFPLAEKLAKKALEQGRLLILLDGVDELYSEHRKKTIAQIEAFIEQYPKNHFIVSDRISSANPWQKLMPVALANFNSEQIVQGIEGWFAVFGQDGTAAQSFLQAWQKPEHQQAKVLAQVPLWLNLLCYVYHHCQTIPGNRILLYQQTIDILLAQIAPKLNQAAIESWLAQIAYQSLVTEKLCFYRSDLIDQMPADIISSANGATAEEILEAIATDQGILSPISSDLLAFSHHSGQDFFAAKYILEHRLMAISVKEYLTVWRWQEVFLFVAGLRKPNADKLLLLIEAYAQEYIEPDKDRKKDANKNGKQEANKLRSLLDWGDQVTADTNTGAIVPAAKRTAALFIVFALQDTFDRQNPLINELDLSLHNNPLLTNSLKLSQSLGLNLTKAIENTRSLTNDFRQNLTFALSHPLDIEKLSRNLTRNVPGKLAQNLARYLSLSFDSSICDQPEISLNRARDLAFVSILVQQLQTMPVFADISSLIAGWESLQLKIPSNNDSAEIHSQFRQILWETCLNSLQLDAELLELTPAEKQSLSDYFSACCLLVRCREAAVDVTPETWHMISERMVKTRL